MKTYTFYYYDSIDNFNSGDRIEFLFIASRFSSAFNAFYNFIVRSRFNYFTFANVYKVTNVCKSSYRVLPSKYYYDLDSLRRLSNEICT